MRVTFAFIPFCSQFGNSDDCGLGTFSEYSQVCSHKAERGEGESCGGSQAWWPPLHALAEPWESRRQQGHFAQSC